MGLSKTEINLQRLLVVAPQQHNQAKLLHYVITLRDQLEQLAEERTSGVPRISKASVNDYLQKIEAIAAKLAVLVFDTQATKERVCETIVIREPSKTDDEGFPSSPGLRRRNVVRPSTFKDKVKDTIEASDQSTALKLDSAAQAHIIKQRSLQEDLTDEMVGLAKQLKESSQLMSQSLKNTEKIIDSTEKAIEHSLASTGQATARAVDVYSKSSNTSCLQLLVIFTMACVFLMVVLLIRLT